MTKDNFLSITIALSRLGGCHAVCGIPKQQNIAAVQTARQGFRLAAQAHVRWVKAMGKNTELPVALEKEGMG